MNFTEALQKEMESIQPICDKVDKFTTFVTKNLSLIQSQAKKDAEDLLNQLRDKYPDKEFVITNWNNSITFRVRNINTQSMFYEFITIDNSGVKYHYPIENTITNYYEYKSVMEIFIYELINDEVVKSFVDRLVENYKKLLPLKMECAKIMVDRTNAITKGRKSLMSVAFTSILLDEEIVFNPPIEYVSINGIDYIVHKLHLETKGKSLGNLTITGCKKYESKIEKIDIVGRKKRNTILDWVEIYLYRYFYKITEKVNI